MLSSPSVVTATPLISNHSFDGKALGSPYEPHKYDGPEPTADIDNAETYHGSCHCGAVTLALKSAPLDKNFPGNIMDCICSICIRVSQPLAPN